MLDLLEVKKSFAQPDGTRLPILDIPEFHVDAGEQMVLVGRSGCGKTTLLHVIAGISRPDSGHVRVDDWDITLFSEAESDRFRAERIGYVFQTFNLMRGFTALENVMLAMRFTGKKPDRKRARNLLDRVGLDHRVTHRPSQLSVGEQQRVAVARALANKPQILLADEPTANVRRRASAAGARFLAEDLRRGERRLGVGHPQPRGRGAIRPRRAFGGVQSRWEEG